MQTVDLTIPVPKQRKRPVNYNSKSLELARSWGYIMGKCDYYDMRANVTHDLFGFLDYVGLADEHTMGFQFCGKDWSSHITKLTVERRDIVTKWLRCPARKLILIGWRKLQGKWSPRVADFWLENEVIKWKERC